MPSGTKGGEPPTVAKCLNVFLADESRDFYRPFIASAQGADRVEVDTGIPERKGVQAPDGARVLSVVRCRAGRWVRPGNGFAFQAGSKGSYKAHSVEAEWAPLL